MNRDAKKIAKFVRIQTLHNSNTVLILNGEICLRIIQRDY